MFSTKETVLAIAGNFAARLEKKGKAWRVVALAPTPVKPLDTDITVSALPARQMLVRSCELPVTKEKALYAALAFQIEPQLPYKAEEGVIQAQVIDRKAKSTKATALAVRSSHLAAHLESFTTDKVSCVPLALAALSTTFSEQSAPLFLVHEGTDEVTCCLVNNGKLLAARAFDVSTELGTEVHKTVLSFETKHKIEKIWVIGEHAELIAAATEKETSVPTSSLLPPEKLPTYAVAAGCAMASSEVDFRQGSFAPKLNWQRLQKPLLTTAVLSTVLTLTLFAFGKSALKRTEMQVESGYRSLMEVEGKEISALPLTKEAYARALYDLKKEVHSKRATFPLLPGVPKVRELLSWLGEADGVEIKKLRYHMVKRPDLSHQKGKYKVRVELDAKAADGNAFHTLLTTPNALVDSREEVTWQVSKGTYRTTFYLKDKTVYR